MKSKVSKHIVEASHGGINRPSPKTSHWEEAAEIYILTGRSGDSTPDGPVHFKPSSRPLDLTVEI